MWLEKKMNMEMNKWFSLVFICFDSFSRSVGFFFSCSLFFIEHTRRIDISSRRPITALPRACTETKKKINSASLFNLIGMLDEEEKNFSFSSSSLSRYSSKIRIEYVISLSKSARVTCFNFVNNVILWWSFVWVHCQLTKYIRLFEKYNHLTKLNCLSNWKIEDETQQVFSYLPIVDQTKRERKREENIRLIVFSFRSINCKTVIRHEW